MENTIIKMKKLSIPLKNWENKKKNRKRMMKYTERRQEGKLIQ